MASSVSESAVQEELQAYLSEKGVNSLFIRIIEQLLMEKPDNAPCFIINHLLETFPDETAKYHYLHGSGKNNGEGKDAGDNIESKEENTTEIIESSDDEDEDEEDDYVDELPELPKSTGTTTRGRRISVSAGVINMETAANKKVVFPKSSEEAEKLTKIISENWLCSHLNSQDTKTLVDAVEKKVVENNVDIITQGDKNADHYYILGEGTACVLKDEVNVLEYSVGDAFGELALMYNAPRAATVRSSSKCTVWCLDQMTFKVILMGSAIKRREKYTKFLGKVPIFSEMAEMERMTLADSLQEKTYAKGECIIKQGDPGDEFFLISSGTLTVTKDGKFLSELGEGNYFGEIALLTNKNRQATITVGSPNVVLLKVHRKVFQRVLGPLSEILKRNMVAYSQFVSGVKI